MAAFAPRIAAPVEAPIAALASASDASLFRTCPTVDYEPPPLTHNANLASVPTPEFSVPFANLASMDIPFDSDESDDDLDEAYELLNS